MVKGFELDTVSFAEFKEKYEDYIFTKSKKYQMNLIKTIISKLVFAVLKLEVHI